LAGVRATSTRSPGMGRAQPVRWCWEWFITLWAHYVDLAERHGSARAGEERTAGRTEVETTRGRFAE